MEIKEKKINNVVIKPIKLDQIDKSKQVGIEYVDDLYANIFLCAKKKSGKTTVLFNLLKNSINKETKVYFFVSTINKDDSYKKILQYLDKKNIYFETYDSMIDDKIDLLKELICKMKEETDEISEEEKEEEVKNAMFKYCTTVDDISVTIEKKKRKSKPRKIAPKFLIIFDDISAEIRNSQSIRSLLKMNRHMKSRIIISSQYPNDLFPDSRAQIDIWILFRGHNDEKLKLIYDSSDPTMDFERFKKLYEHSTKEPYNVFYIDTRNSTYRKNFNTLLE